jgi:GTP cyclohydrolase IA
VRSKQNFARMAEAARPDGHQDGTQRGVDLDAAERAAADLLAALGIDLDREERRATPGRMARAYAELLTARPFRLTTFPNDEGYDELVLARAIPFRTLCEHHMLLFSGVAHVGYLPGERILGLSKLARLVGHFAAQPQTQERLTMQVAKCLDANLRPRGAGVVLEAEHTCMTQRGIRAHGATTVTSALLGTLRTGPGPAPSSSPWPGCPPRRDRCNPARIGVSGP